MNDKLANSTSV